jgi:hypothetical protein
MLTKRPLGRRTMGIAEATFSDIFRAKRVQQICYTLLGVYSELRRQPRGGEQSSGARLLVPPWIPIFIKGGVVLIT